MRFLSTFVGSFVFLIIAACGQSEAFEQARVQSKLSPSISLTDFPDEFAFPAPTTLVNKRNFWATNYFLPVVDGAAKGEVALLDMNDKPLGPRLRKEDWCSAALEGSVLVRDPLKNVFTTFNYAGIGQWKQTSCGYRRYPRTDYIRFRPAIGAYGDGTDVDGRLARLMPYRTIAVAKSEFPYGTVLFIPAARGIKFKLPSGVEKSHDGYFFAGDKGGAMEQDAGSKDRNFHIDVFTGTSEAPNFTFIKSNPNYRYPAYIVNDSAVVSALRSLHLD